MTNPSYFIKSETSYNGNFANYTGIGKKIKNPHLGTSEVMFAKKTSGTQTGGFGEYKYTSPELFGNWKLESRTRCVYDKEFESNNTSNYLNQRVAFKGNWNYDNNWGSYIIAGVNSKIGLDKATSNSATLLTLAGVSKDIGKHLNIYGEVEVSKGYNFSSKEMGNFAPAGYLGIKYTF